RGPGLGEAWRGTGSTETGARGRPALGWSAGRDPAEAGQRRHLGDRRRSRPSRRLDPGGSLMPRHRLTPGRARRIALLPTLALLAACSAVRPGLAAERASGRCAESIPDIYDRASPAVVFIGATSINPYKLSDRVTHVVGSGFIIDSGGLILTNAHVAFGRQSIRVTLDDGTVLSAELVGADAIFDLAVLRIPPPEKTTLPTLALGDSDRLRVGEEVVAIGNPLGLDQTLTRGVVSALNRILPDTPYSIMEPLIQTD